MVFLLTKVRVLRWLLHFLYSVLEGNRRCMEVMLLRCHDFPFIIFFRSLISEKYHLTFELFSLKVKKWWRIVEKTHILALNRVVFESWVYPLTSYLISGELLYFFEFLFFFSRKNNILPKITFSTYPSLTTDILMAKLRAFHHCFNIIRSIYYFYEECAQKSKCSSSYASKVIGRINNIFTTPSSMLCIY